MTTIDIEVSPLDEYLRTHDIYRSKQGKYPKTDLGEYAKKYGEQSKRIGVAKDISLSADFDDIDYGTEELFGLKDK